MKEKGSKKIFWTILAVTAVLSFLAFYIGVKYIAGNTVLPRNILGYAVFSLIFGAVASALYLLRMKITAGCFLGGVAVGFGMMYRSFASDLSGWEDLAGLMNLFIWVIIGLSVGVFIQLGRWIYFRLREPK